MSSNNLSSIAAHEELNEGDSLRVALLRVEATKKRRGGANHFRVGLRDSTTNEGQDKYQTGQTKEFHPPTIFLASVAAPSTKSDSSEAAEEVADREE
jgi:hypothetical protein